MQKQLHHPQQQQELKQAKKQQQTQQKQPPPQQQQQQHQHDFDEAEDEDEEKFTYELTQRGKIREELKNTIEDMEQIQNDLTDIKKRKFQTMNQNLNHTFEKIHHPRELTLDAVGMKILSTSLKSQALKLSDLSKQYNFDSLTMRLKELFGIGDGSGDSGDGQGMSSSRGNGAVGNHLDWNALGMEVRSILAAPIPLTTMVGPFQKEEKIRKAPVRRKEIEDEKNLGPVKPKEVVQEGDEEINEATNQRVKHLLDTVRELTQESIGGRKSKKRRAHVDEEKEDTNDEIGFDLLELLVDPVDDVQSIENFFDFAFLIKEKSVIQALNEDNLPIAIASTGDDANDQLAKKQMVLTITTKELKQLRELLYGSSAEARKYKHPLHRNDEVYQVPVSINSSSLAMNSSSSKGLGEGKENSLNVKDEVSTGQKRKNAKTKH